MGWKKASFKNRQVWVLVDEDGTPVRQNGLIPMKYSESEDAKVYTASPKNVVVEGASTSSGKSKSPSASKKSFDELVWQKPAGRLVRSQDVPNELLHEPAPPAGVIEIYTDGACTGNPGPCGYGVVVREGDAYEELSQYIGIGTNNIAELLAIKVALEESRNRDGKIRIHTDSRYSIGVLTKGWKAKANRELIAETLELLAQFDERPKLVKVKGHAGIPLNERADALATGSVERGE